MTDLAVAVAGPDALQAASVLHASAAIDDTATLTAHPPPIPSSNPFDHYSSQSSAESQHSRPAALKLSTSRISAPGFEASATGDLTPPSSATSKSPADVTGGDGALPKSQHGSQSPPILGTKRTASGEFKRSSVIENHGTGNDMPPMQSVGVLSNGSSGNVKEISQQLRTKLTYAMVKVQNGWQGRSLDEVESLASASPRSTISGFGLHLEKGSLSSPRTAMSAKHRKWSESDSSDSAASDARASILSASHPMRNGHHDPTSRGLAPPAHITQGTRRRPTPNGNVLLRQPQYHPPRLGPNQRTPSQSAAMEADAVETLLFMASPSNSGYHPPSQSSQDSSLRSTQLFASQTSPLRAQFSQASVTSPKKVAFTDPTPAIPVVNRNALIDRMLDELSDDSDQELDEALRLADKSSAMKVLI